MYGGLTMNRSHLLSAAICLSLVGGLGLLAPGQVHAQGSSTKAGEPLPAKLSLPSIPANAVEVTDAVKAAQPGQTVTLHGRIAMAKDAFAAGGAGFTLSDDAAVAGCCPADGTLMDTCTFTGAAKAVVKVAGAGAKLEGKGGLRHGAEVFVVGKVDSSNGSDSLVVTATGIYVPEGSLPAGFFSKEVPADAKDLSAVRKAATLKKGDTVVLRGVIGGSRDPFVANRAMFTLMGSGLKPCNANPDDKCKTPWDYCCDPKSEIAAHSATIRVADAKGNPLRTDIKGRQGIKELTEVIVVGTVAVADKGVLIVNATRLHRVKD
jgi:hypothetical protein